jgi:hypothetical protein
VCVCSIMAMNPMSMGCYDALANYNILHYIFSTSEAS